jgi:hypothetical protein
MSHGNLVQVPESVSAVALYYDANKIASFPATTADFWPRYRTGTSNSD